MLLQFDSITRPVLLEQGLKVLPPLGRAFAGWPHREVAREGRPDPLINVLLLDDRYVLQAPWLAEPLSYANPVALADGLVPVVQRAWLRERHSILWIEGAAVEIGGELIVLLGGRRSGKSLVAACLALGGNRIFADGMLPVLPEAGTGLSLGLAPRIRLPLPASLSWPVRSAMEMQKVNGDEALFHLNPGADKLARFGEQAPIRAFVLLDRVDGAPAALRGARQSTVLKRLVLNSGSERLDAVDVLHGLQTLVAGAACYRLAYSDPEAARATLRGRFAMWPASSINRDGGQSVLGQVAARRRPSPPRTPEGRRFCRPDGIRERMVDGDLFLVDRGGNTIYHLNGLGAGLWTLLDDSHGLDDIIDVLGDAFPYMDRVALEDDVQALVGELTQRGLLLERPAAF